MLLLLLLLLFHSSWVFHTHYNGRFSREFEWQQVCSALQDSSKYSCRSQRCCYLDIHISSSGFKFLHSLWGMPSSAPTLIGITVTFIIHNIFLNSLAGSRYFSSFSLSYLFQLSDLLERWNPLADMSVSFGCLPQSLVFWLRLGDPLLVIRSIICVGFSSTVYGLGITDTKLIIRMHKKNFHFFQNL